MQVYLSKISFEHLLKCLNKASKFFMNIFKNASFIYTEITLNNVSTTNVMKTHIHMNFIFN